MMLASLPPAVVTTQKFSELIHAGLGSAAWEAGLTGALAKTPDVTISNVSAGPYPFETYPPKGGLSFELSGPAESITQALAGIKNVIPELDNAAVKAYLAQGAG